MAVTARSRIGDRFIFTVDAVPTHTAPDGSLALLTAAGALYQRVSGAWVQLGTGGGGGGSGALTMISEVVTSGSQATIAFNAIPNTFRHLRLVLAGRGTAAAPFAIVRIQFNGDTGANYDMERQNRTGQVSTNGQTYGEIGAISAASTAANYVGILEALIGNYKGTTFFKPVRGKDAVKFDTTLLAQELSVIWKNTAAINAILLSLDAGAFVDGTVATLYGVQ